MNTKKLVYIGIGAVIFYFIWKKFLKKPEVNVVVNADPIIVPAETQTQGDIVNKLAFAKGY